MKTPAVKIEFKTSEFPNSPLPSRLRSKWSAARKTLNLGVDKIKQKISAASSRRNAALLDRKAKAKKVSKKVETVRVAQRRLSRFLNAKMEEKDAEAALRRFAKRRQELERLSAIHENVFRVNILHRARETADTELSNANTTMKQELAAARRQNELSRRMSFGKGDFEKSRTIANLQHEIRDKLRISSIQTLQGKMEGAETRRRAALNAKRATGGKA